MFLVVERFDKLNVYMKGSYLPFRREIFEWYMEVYNISQGERVWSI